MMWAALHAHWSRVPEVLRVAALAELRKNFLARTIAPGYLDDDATCAAYEEWFFPQSFAKAASVLGELQADVRTVVDLGAAMGPLAFAAWQRWPDAQLTLVDQSAGALRSGRALAERLGAHVETRAQSLTEWRGPTDLILAGNALLELPQPEAAARALLAQLTPHGHLVIIEPADRVHARALQALRDALLPLAPTAPCPHAQPCPASMRPRDFCHQARRLPLPEWWHARAAALGASDERMRFSYLVYAAAPEPQPHGLVRIISHRIKEKGRTRYFACSDAGALELMRQDRLRSRANAAFDDLGRGALLKLSATHSPVKIGVEDTVEVVGPSDPWAAES
jgi:SAM-dependent methyltransferase